MKPTYSSNNLNSVAVAFASAPFANSFALTFGNFTIPEYCGCSMMR